MADDPRYRTKLFLDTYWTAANATDDDGNPLGIQTLYAYPDYPLERELKAPSVVDVLICIDQPTATTPTMDAVTEAPYGYVERIPIELVSVDKTGVTATNALWQAEAELRNVLENHPTGSWRGVERTRPATHRLGSTVLWAAEYTWTYRRDTT